MRNPATITTAQPAGANELIAVRIAGPETARELGVPVGTPVEARHVVAVQPGKRVSLMERYRMWRWNRRFPDGVVPVDQAQRRAIEIMEGR